MPALLTRGAAAAYLAVSERTLDRLIATGRLPAVRLGARHVRIRRADVERAIERGAL